MACAGRRARKFTIDSKESAPSRARPSAIEIKSVPVTVSRILAGAALLHRHRHWHAVKKQFGVRTGGRAQPTNRHRRCWRAKWSNCAMKRRGNLPCDRPTALGLNQQYEEVLRLRHQVVLAETNQDAASRPSDAQPADASGAAGPAGGSCARSGSGSYADQSNEARRPVNEIH